MPVDAFQAAGITPAFNQTSSQPVDAFQAAGVAPPANPSFLPRVGADVLSGVAQMGNGLLNAPHNIAGALANHGIINQSTASSIPGYLPGYNYSQALGVNNPNGWDKFVQGAAQYAPYMMGGEALLAGSAPTLAARAAIQSGAGATFGATQSQNPVAGAAIGASLGAGAELAPAAIGSAGSYLGKSITAIQPQKYAQQIMQILGNGNSLEGNAQSLAQDIKNAYQQRVSQGQSLYQPVFENAGNNSIYQGINQATVRQPVSNFGSLNDVIDHINDSTGSDLETTSDLKDYLMQQHGFSFPDNKSLLNFFNSAPATINNGAYNQLDAGIINSYDRNLNNLHQQFTDNPTLINAHNLQSQLGSSIRKLQGNDAKGNLSVADRNTMQGYQQAQDAVRSDINTYLTSQNPALADQYNAATANWAQNVTPYLESPKISQIAKGDVTNPAAITNLFKNPEPEMQQIVSDIGPQANNKILYSELGKTQANLTPEKLTSAFNGLDNKGLGSYVTPDLAQQFEQLTGRISSRNTAQTAAAGILGAHFFGPLGAVAGAAGPRLLGKLGQLNPSLNLSLGNTLGSALKVGYRPTTQALTADVVGGQ